jgi:phage terminase small subunit
MTNMDAHDPIHIAAKPLSPRAKRFITEYLLDHNGTQAAIRAGYAPSGARALASKMLSNVVVAEAVRDAEAEILKSNQVTIARIVRELALIAFLDPADILDDNGRVLPLNSMPPEIRRGLAAVEIVESPNGTRKFRLGGKLAALVALGKHMTMFTNRVGDDPTDLPPFEFDAFRDDDDDEAGDEARSQPQNA